MHEFLAIVTHAYLRTATPLEEALDNGPVHATHGIHLKSIMAVLVDQRPCGAWRRPSAQNSPGLLGL
jgi:hypothetical protein